MHRAHVSLVLLSLTLAASTASAQSAEGGSTAGAKRPLSAALLVGMGLDVGGAPRNPWVLGFGARAGYQLAPLGQPKIYVGLRFEYFIGSSDELTAGQGGGDLSSSITSIGLEGGYDLSLSDQLTLRPELGLGIAFHSDENLDIFGSSAIDASSSGLYLSPGVAASYDLSPGLFVGVDLHLPVAFADQTLVGLTLMAAGGLRI